MVEFKLPELGENVHSGTVVRVMVAAGQAVAKDQGVLEVETDKAAVEVPSSVAGVVKEVRVKAGDKVSPGQVIFVAEARAAEPAKAQPSPPQAATPPKPAGAVAPPPVQPKQADAAEPSAPPSSLVPVSAAPSVRRFAREIGVDIALVKGSGPDGHISVEDVKAYAQKGHAARSAANASIAAPPLPDFGHWGPVERQPMSGVRRSTAEHMSLAWSQIPHVTHHDVADITELEARRLKSFASATKLTVTGVALKIVAAALKQFPQFNASIDAGSGEIIYKKYYHVGVAVDTDRGLLVPVIKDVDKKSIAELSAELAAAAEKARGKKLSLDEMKGGTFTITNLGGIGGTHFSPIVNWPEVAILGMARASERPVYVGGVLVPRLILPLSLSYDHRIIDGADGARFLRWIGQAFEQPMKMAFEGLI